MKRFFIPLAAFMMAGCGSSTQYLLTTPNPSAHYSRSLPVIGVEKIVLPEYMQKGKLATQRTSTQIVYSGSSQWAGEMDESLTKELISYIQKSFNHPGVYGYPWDISQSAGIKIRVNISRFIAYGSKVYLDASWEMVRSSGGRSSGLFSVALPTGTGDAAVVDTMNQAYARLCEAVAARLAK